jgi:hypothetical protein
MDGKIEMENKQEINARLQKVFNQWQDLLTCLSEEQILAPLLPSTWTIKDTVAHMWAWQQATVARAEAALLGKDPDYPEWWKIMGPDPEEDVDRTNAYLNKINRDKPWSRVRTDWNAQFSRYLELARQIPEKDLFEAGRYAWMGSYPLLASTMGTLEHHEEHLEALQTWLHEHVK